MIWIVYVGLDTRIALFVCCFRVIISLRHVWVVEVYDIFLFMMYFPFDCILLGLTLEGLAVDSSPIVDYLRHRLCYVTYIYI